MYDDDDERLHKLEDQIKRFTMTTHLLLVQYSIFYAIISISCGNKMKSKKKNTLFTEI